MNYKEAAKQVAAGKAESVYVCLGTERFLVNQFIEYVLQQTIPEEVRDFAISRYDLRETPIDACIEDAETLPFMAEKKIIVADHATFLTAARDKQKVEHNLQRFTDYVHEPAPYTIIILIVEAEKLDERKKVVKQLKKQDAIVLFPTMDAKSLKQWVIKQAAQADCELADAAADALIMNVGTNLQQLAAELEKMALYAGEDRKISKQMIEQLVVRSVEQNIFMLVDTIVNHDLPKALSIYQELLNRREEPIKILMLIARQFRIIMQVKELSKHGYTNRQIASQVGLHPYAVTIAQKQTKNYSIRQLNWILERLANADYQMKTGQMDKILVVEMLLLELAHSQSKAAALSHG